MSEQKKITLKKNILWIILAITMAVFFAGWMLGSDIEHIEDANGPDDTSLAVITDENIINQDMGALNVNLHRSLVNDGVTCESDNFSGVYRIFLTNFLFDSDFEMELSNFHVNSGNFRMCIVNEGKIIADVEPGMFAEVSLSGLNGAFELIIAGESADFTFYMDKMFCERYGIMTDE